MERGKTKGVLDSSLTCCVSRKMTVGRQEVVLGVWDTAGSERYESMTKMYYR